MGSSKRRTWRAYVSASIVFAATAALEQHAQATPRFPERIATELQLAGPPACTLCHDGPTQRGTVTTPFGAAMRSRGLVAYDEGSLTLAIAALQGEKKDSDEDGTPDIEELVTGSDPNDSPNGADALVANYGCGLGNGGGGVGVRAASLLIAGLVLAAKRRRGRAS